MKVNIIEKLRLELAKDVKEESQVVYILSRIRKLIEIDNKLDKYDKLKFYCDWSLHNEIDRNQKLLAELFGDLPDGKTTNYSLILEVFRQEFNRFLLEYKLETTITKNLENENVFKKLLIGIYSDTPLIIKSNNKYVVTVKKGEFYANTSHVEFSVSEIK